MSISSTKKILSPFFSGFLVLGVIAPSLIPLQAGIFSKPKIPNPSDFASDMEQRYHINPENIQDQGETLNVSDNKKGTPQVSLFFTPSDPQEGQKITARSFPIYFASDSSDMYFTWYLQRSECKKNNSPSGTVRDRCDLNGDGRVGIEDWKIEAARIIATDGYDANFTSYTSDSDNDGYQARFGGNSRVNVPNYCYYHDNTSGENYEIVEDVGDTTFDGCTNGEAVCMEGTVSVDPGEISASASGGSSSAGGDTFEVNSENDTVTGYPYCDASGVIGCINGTPCCVGNAVTATNCTADITGTTCSASSSGSSNPVCKHLFAKPSGFVSGDGSFGAGEEAFWQTDPNDPNTSDNGNKDEANVVGLGQESFTWNYSPGDKVGVVIEGLSMNPTKHDDSSNMIMWGFSKNTCDYRKFDANTGTYQKNIRGYNVSIQTIDLNLNDCLEDNLVDPLEGGQATGLEVDLQATPDNPINDGSGGNSGDTVSVIANINNSAQELQSTYFDWKVYLSRDGTPNPPAGGWENITPWLSDESRKFLSQYKGNGLGSISVALNFKDSTRSEDFIGGRPLSSYTPSGVGYLKFQVDVAENFNPSGTASRRGKSDVIVKFTSTSDRIGAYIVDISGDPARLSLTNKEICSGTVNPADSEEKQILTKLDAKLCRVIKNEIIGLKVVSPEGSLSNFSWTINGLPLVCNTQVSASCPSDTQGAINFFPIIGNVGDVFTITVSGTKASYATGRISGESAPALSGKAITLSRSFKIVEPGVSIETADENQAWPKILGRYTDPSTGQTYPDLSKTTLQAFAGSVVKLKAAFTPDFLGSFTPPQVERSWAVDSEGVGDGSSNEISFATLKEPGEIYNVTLTSVYRPSTLTRKALLDIWNISSLDTTEMYFKTETQLEHPEQIDLAQAGTNKYLALVSSYLPAPLLFSIRIFLSVGLIIFVTGFLFALIPNAPARLERFRH